MRGPRSAPIAFVQGLRLTGVNRLGKWKVIGVRYGGMELATIKALPPVPAEQELERLAATVKALPPVPAERSDSRIGGWRTFKRDTLPLGKCRCRPQSAGCLPG